MQHLQINPAKNFTVHMLMQKQFPAIKSSDNKPTMYVTPKTISYIHDCNRLHSPSIIDANNQRALRNEIMILEVLEALEPALFRQNLANTFTHYYEEVQSMFGAGGRPKPKSFKLKMNVGDGLPLAPAAEAQEDNDVPPPSAAAAAADPPPQADDDDTAAVAAATPPPSRTGGEVGNWPENA